MLAIKLTCNVYQLCLMYEELCSLWRLMLMETKNGNFCKRITSFFFFHVQCLWWVTLNELVVFLIYLFNSIVILYSLIHCFLTLNENYSFVCGPNMILKHPLLKVFLSLVFKSIISKMDIKQRFPCSYISVYVVIFEYLIMDFLNTILKFSVTWFEIRVFLLCLYVQKHQNS